MTAPAPTLEEQIEACEAVAYAFPGAFRGPMFAAAATLRSLQSKAKAIKQLAYSDPAVVSHTAFRSAS